MHRREHDARRGMPLQNRLGGGDAAHAGHHDVGHDHVGHQPIGGVDEGLAVTHSGDDIELRLEQGAPKLHRRRVIVSEQDTPASHSDHLLPPVGRKNRNDARMR
jgi:hypothetical protein